LSIDIKFNQIKQIGREVEVEDVLLMADLALMLKDLDLTQFKVDFKNAFEQSLRGAFQSV
jgi:hypothetical protein